MWFRNIYSKCKTSPDSEKCQIIHYWPSPTSMADIKSFLQTVQFNRKFLAGKPSEKSYPELTAPLQALTKINARFIWEQKSHLSSRKSRNDYPAPPYLQQTIQSVKQLYVDFSPVATQATLAQAYEVDGQEHFRPINLTSPAWTKTEAAYSQIQQGSNRIVTEMYMNKMYTLEPIQRL